MSEQHNPKVLIACEESQTECTAFREAGCEAYSCDLKVCSGAHPEYHIVGDALSLLNGGNFETMTGDAVFVDAWDLIIAHPPCTYLSKAGATRLFNNCHQVDTDRYIQGLVARDFFMRFYLFGLYGVGRIVIENPTPLKIFDLPKPTQIVQPYQFGDPFYKRTLLWEFGVRSCTRPILSLRLRLGLKSQKRKRIAPKHSKDFPMQWPSNGARFLWVSLNKSAERSRQCVVTHFTACDMRTSCHARLGMVPTL